MSAGDQWRAGALAISAPRFVGRERELATLRQALAGPPAVLLVEGEAGIGKSRLVRELLARPGSGQRPAAALVGVCPPVRQPFTLGPVVDALRHATGRISGLALPPLCGALRPLFPEWADHLPVAPEPLADASAARHRLFRAIAEVLEQLGVRLVIVEDVHWADEATLELLLFLATREDRMPSLLVTYRPEEVPADSLLRRFTSRPSVAARVSLSPLDAADTARLVSSMLDDEPVSAEFAGFLCRHTDGLPLAIEESVRLLHDRADLIREDGGWVRRDLAEMVIPPSVRDAVLERAGRLGHPGQAVLRAAAVLTDPVAEPVLLAVAGQLDGRAGDGLAEALGSGLIAQDARGMVAYRHVLACRAVYESIPVRELRRTHRRRPQCRRCSQCPALRRDPRNLRAP